MLIFSLSFLYFMGLVLTSLFPACFCGKEKFYVCPALRGVFLSSLGLVGSAGGFFLSFFLSFCTQALSVFCMYTRNARLWLLSVFLFLFHFKDDRKVEYGMEWDMDQACDGNDRWNGKWKWKGVCRVRSWEKMKWLMILLCLIFVRQTRLGVPGCLLLRG